MALPTAPTVRSSRPHPHEERYPHSAQAPLRAHARAVAVVAAAGYHPEVGVTRMVVNRSLLWVMPPVGTSLDIRIEGGKGSGVTRPAVLAEVYAHGILVRRRSGVRVFVSFIDLYATASLVQVFFPPGYAERVDAVRGRLRELSPKSQLGRLAVAGGLVARDDGGEV